MILKIVSLTMCFKNTTNLINVRAGFFAAVHATIDIAARICFLGSIKARVLIKNRRIQLPPDIWRFCLRENQIESYLGRLYYILLMTFLNCRLINFFIGYGLY